MRLPILQHEYAISTGLGPFELLSTKGVWTCTAWYGWDTKNGISFLCHFDHPWSADSTPEILNCLNEVAPSSHRFQSVLVGGKRWLWSGRTREKIRHYVESQNEVKIKIREVPMDGWLDCRRRQLVVSTRGGRMRKDIILEGDSAPRGICWYFGPMKGICTHPLV